MKKAVKGTLIGVGSFFGALIIGAGVLYAVYGQPPELEREVGVLEELLPEGCVSYVVVPDLDAAGKLYKSSELHGLVRKLNIDKDFSSLAQTKRLQERSKGQLWDLIGSRLIYALYPDSTDEVQLVITQPHWNARMLWKAALSQGEEFEQSGIPYAVFSDGSAIAFAGEYFWFASSEDLMLAALRLAGSDAIEESEYGIDELDPPLAYGLTRKSGKHLQFTELRWILDSYENGLELDMTIAEPGGVIGSFLSEIEDPVDYSSIPENAVMFINLAGADAFKAWQTATALAIKQGSTKGFADADVDKPLTMLTTDIGDEMFLVMQGWDTTRWYAPARWVVAAEGSRRSFETWQMLVPWLFPDAWRDTSLTIGDVDFNSVEFGSDFPSISYFDYSDRFVLTSDTSLVKWITDAWTGGSSINDFEDYSSHCSAAGIDKPVAYLHWPRFVEVLEPFLVYTAERSPAFTPADIDKKLNPFLQELALQAVVVESAITGDDLTVIIRTVK